MRELNLQIGMWVSFVQGGEYDEGQVSDIIGDSIFICILDPETMTASDDEIEVNIADVLGQI